MPALWEQSLVYTRRVSMSGKNDVNTEETMADGTEDLVFKRKLNVLYLFDSSRCVHTRRE